MFNKILLIILLFFVRLCVAQDLDAVRIEVPSNLEAEQFHVEPIGNNGLLIFYETLEVNKENKRKWYFGLFDTNLKQIWLKFVPLNDKIEFISSHNKNGNVYFVFKNISSEKFEYGFYQIVIYNLKKQSFSTISGSIPLKAEVAGFDIIGRTACLALNLKKHITDLVFINLNNGDVNPVHIDEGVPGIIEAIYADKNNRSFYIAIKQNRDRRYITDKLFAYSLEGKRISEIDIKGNETLKYFQKYSFISQKNNELLIFGTYDILTGRKLSFKDIEDELEAKSVGLFFLKIVDGKQEMLKYYDFMTFDNIAGAIRLKDISTIKLPEDTTQYSSAKQFVAASFMLTDPLLIKSSNNEYILSAEAFRPYYVKETRMDYDFYGRPYPYTYNIFSGYEFYDVIIVSFSSNGELLWDNDFVIEDILTYSKKRNSVVFKDDNFITSAYINNGYVVSQTIDGSVDIDRSKMKIGTKFTQDRIAQDENNHIVNWYDDYFLIYGYQKLKNRTLGEQSTRVVFYANKIAYK